MMISNSSDSRLVELALVMLIAIMAVAFIGCSDKPNNDLVSTSGATGVGEGQNHLASGPPPPAQPRLGFYFQTVEHWPEAQSYVAQYGPSGVGFELWTFDRFDYCEIYHTAALNQGYDVRIISIDRNWISVSGTNWTEVDNVIARAQRVGASHVYVDDCLSGNFWNWPVISVANMQNFITRVHNAGLQVACSEVLNTVNTYASQYPGFHNGIDLIMPYEYGITASVLDSRFITFYTSVRSNISPAPKVIPFINGHHRTISYSQINADCIASALEYSTENAVYLYIEPDAASFTVYFDTDSQGYFGVKHYVDLEIPYLQSLGYLPY